MTHWGELIVNDEIHISGRGIILTVNLKENKLVEGNWTKESPISVGDTLIYKGNEYKISGIEGFRNLLDGAASHLMGLVVNKNV